MDRQIVRIVAILLCLCLPIAGLTAVGSYPERFFDLRTESMGFAGVALYDSTGSIYLNPASLYFQSENQFLLFSDFGTSVVPSDFTDGALLPFFQNPTNRLQAIFSNRYLAFSLGLGYSLEDRTEDTSEGTVKFKGLNSSELQLNISYGSEMVSLGFFARGGSTMERSSIVLGVDSAFIDYIQGTFLEKYVPIADQQFFTTGAGLLLRYKWISMGVVTDSLFVMDYSSNEMMLEAGALLDTLSFGIALSTPTYGFYDELNLFVFTTCFDVANLGDDDNREIRMGMELCLQLLPEYKISLRYGYHESRSSISRIFSLDGSDGMTSFGVDVLLDRLCAQVTAQIPLSMYDGILEQGESFYLRLGINMVL